MYLVLGSGSIILASYVLAFLFKISHLVSVLVCPICMTSCKKKNKKIPVDFSHYVGEFEFVCSTEPDVWSC